MNHPRPTGTLFVNAIPSARVSVDGVDRGSTPWSGAISVGRHEVALTGLDGDPTRRTIAVFADHESKLCWDMAQQTECPR
jgi:hypothetical protein